MSARSLLRSASAAFALAAALSGCEPDGPGPAVRAPGGQLYPWAGPFQGLYDDGIDPAALGTAFDLRDPALDPLIKDRTRTAELVARMRVKTMFRRAVGERVGFILVMEVGYALTTPKIAERELELTIPQGTPAFEVLNANEAVMRSGRVFIGFVRRFAGQNGPELHWHLTADSVEVARAVEAASALRDLAH